MDPGNIGDIGDIFEARYYSSFIRARETAEHLGSTSLAWRKHNMLHERDWGHFGITPRSEQAARFSSDKPIEKKTLRSMLGSMVGRRWRTVSLCA